MNIFFVTVFYAVTDQKRCYTNCIGYFTDYQEATESVINNVMDIYESTYDYAVIEECLEGFYPVPVNQWFYKFDDKTRQYKFLEEPLPQNLLDCLVIKESPAE